MMQTDKALRLRLGHSPDPDDAFMWWPIVSDEGSAAGFDTRGFHFEQVLDDIESLNHRAQVGELEITAISCAQYPYVADRYALTACGSSMGDNYGPKIVARRAMGLEELTADGMTLAVPGERTSAFGAASLLLGPGAFRFQVVQFDQIISRVAGGQFDAGLVIHEGQLTFAEAGLEMIVDLGSWWTSRNGMPLPLGVSAIRRDLDDSHGPGTLQRVTTVLLESLRFALAHREEALQYALRFARDTPPSLADRFVSMYVNKWTLDFGDLGREAVRTFLRQLNEAGLVPEPPSIEFIDPG